MAERSRELADAMAAQAARKKMSEETPMRNPLRTMNDENGRVGYLVLYLMGVPIGLLLLLWVIFGNNLLGAG